MPDFPTPQIIRSKRRTASLYVLPNATVLVKAPMRMRDSDINTFIHNNIAWIQKRLQAIQSLPIAVRKYEHGEKFFFLGDLHSLDIGNYTQIAAKDGILHFPSFLKFRLKKEIDSWYMMQAKDVITRLVEKYAGEMNVAYRSLTFSDTKSRWGSCSHDNHLQFNWRLVMAPMLVIIYVVTHELAHINEKNHSEDFWRRVRRYNPSYRQSRKWLKDHGNLLFL